MRRAPSVGCVARGLVVVAVIMRTLYHNLAPRCTHATARANKLARMLPQDGLYRLPAHTRAFELDVSDGERTLKGHKRSLNACALVAAMFCNLHVALIGSESNVENI